MMSDLERKPILAALVRNQMVSLTYSKHMTTHNGERMASRHAIHVADTEEYTIHYKMHMTEHDTHTQVKPRHTIHYKMHMTEHDTHTQVKPRHTIHVADTEEYTVHYKMHMAEHNTHTHTHTHT
jgi:hypothetical protein